MSRVDDLTEAQREIDAMLPGTPPIAPAPPLALPGCIEIPADAPFLRARFAWNDVGLVLSALLTIVCFARAVITFESRMQDVAALHAEIEHARMRMMDTDADIRALREAAYDMEVRTARARERLERIAHEKRGCR